MADLRGLALRVRLTWLERFVLLEMEPDTPQGETVGYAYEDLAADEGDAAEAWQS